jgi:HK97 family phage prohead protease
MAARRKKPSQSDREGLEQREAPPLTFRAAVLPSSLDEEKRTVDVTWSTGAEVARRDWWSGERFREALSLDPSHIRLGRLESGAPLLDSHSSWSTRSVLGVVESARLEGGKGVATVRFSERAEADVVFKDVKAGILRNISVGYAVHKWEDTRNAEGKLEKRTAIDWEPYELSIVPIGADAGAQVRAFEDDEDDGSAPRAEERSASMEETEQQRLERLAKEAEAKRAAEAQRAADEARAQALVEERKRVADIVELCRVHGVDETRRASWVADGANVQSVRDAILDSHAQRARDTHVSPITSGDGTREASMRRDASDALLRRANEKVEGDGHRNFGDAVLMDMARSFLESGGVNTRGMGRLEIATRALATTDFASVLYLVGEKTMRAGYDAVPLVHRQVLKKTSASDFRPRNTVAVDAGDLLEEVAEGAPIPQKGARFETGQYALKSYGKIVSFTRKMLIDDDIGALTEVSRSRGRAAAETERKLVWDFILGNPTAPDGTAVFENTVHANFPATAATTTDVAAIDAANTFFRTAKSLAGIPINASLRYIVASDSADRALDRLLYGGYVPTAAASGVTERDRRIAVLCEPMISATKQHWLGFADPNQASSFEYAYLTGTAEGVRLEQKAGFEVEGLMLKVCLDFGIGCADWRGVYYKRQT